MQKLIEGIHRFQGELFGSRREMFQGLARGQRPEALFITCSDSRINPNLVTQTEPGELFILRNAGNIIPPHRAADGGESATIEYAVAVLKVRDIILCGHSHCGAVGALLDPPSRAELPAVAEWLEHAEAARRIVQQNYSDLPPDRKLVAAVEENVLVQIDHLRTHPTVAAGLARGEIHLHAWVYKFETGEIFAYDPGRGQFLPLDDAREEGTSPRRLARTG